MDSTTIDPDELARFSALADSWWDPEGKFKALHRFNPVRLAYIKEVICRRLERDERARDALTGLRIADIGCGGGLVSEPLARLGADVLGIDPLETNIKTAAAHLKSEAEGLALRYRTLTAGALVEEGENFDVVLVLEVVEHVANVPAFVASCAALARPGGLVFVATINRTGASFFAAIVGAEYVLRWLPVGTHQWDRFITPGELSAHGSKGGLHLIDQTGVYFNPLGQTWHRGRSMAVNYMMVFEK